MRTSETQAHPEKEKKGSGGLFTFYSLTQTHWTLTLFPGGVHLAFLLWTHPCCCREQARTGDASNKKNIQLQALIILQSSASTTHTHAESTGCFLSSKWVSVSGTCPHFRQTFVYLFWRSYIPGWDFTDNRGQKRQQPTNGHDWCIQRAAFVR